MTLPAVVHAPWAGRCTADDESWPCAHMLEMWSILDPPPASPDAADGHPS